MQRLAARAVGVRGGPFILVALLPGKQTARREQTRQVFSIQADQPSHLEPLPSCCAVHDISRVMRGLHRFHAACMPSHQLWPRDGCRADTSFALASLDHWSGLGAEYPSRRVSGTSDRATTGETDGCQKYGARRYTRF